MQKRVLCLCLLLSVSLSGCGQSVLPNSEPLPTETNLEIVLPEPEPLPTEMRLDTENAMIEDMTIEKLYELNHGDVRIIYNSSTNIPCEIYGLFTTNSILSEQDAFRSLLGMRGIFKFSDECTFAFGGFDDSRSTARIYVFHQLYKGVLVEGCKFEVCTTKEGIPMAITGIYCPIDGLDVKPKFSATECLSVIPMVEDTYISSVSLVVLPFDTHNHLCWKYEELLNDEEYLLNHIYYVDAHSGELIYTGGHLMF